MIEKLPVFLTANLALLSILTFLSGCHPKAVELGGSATQIDQNPMRAPVAPKEIEIRTIENPEPHLAKVVMAIFPLQNNTDEKEFASIGFQLADLIDAQLSSRRDISLVERRRINEIIGELDLGDVGPVDQATAARLGGLLGANVLAFGSIGRLNGKVVLSMRLSKVETGEIIGGITEIGDAANLAVMATNASNHVTDALARRSH